MDAERCEKCGARFAPRPIPFFPGAATWRPADAPPEVPQIAESAPETLETHFDDPHLFGEESAPLQVEAPVAPPPPKLAPAQALGPVLGSPTARDLAPAAPAPAPAPAPARDPASEPLTDDTSTRPNETISLPPRAGSEVIRVLKVAPLWRRVAAGAIDALPILGAGMLTLLAYDKKLEAGRAPLVPGSLENLARMYWSLEGSTWVVLSAVLLVAIAYHTFCVGYMQATVGDLILGMRWVTRDGSAPKPLRAFARAIALIPSWLLFGAGVWSVILVRTRRALYDIMSGCYLVLKDE